MVARSEALPPRRAKRAFDVAGVALLAGFGWPLFGAVLLLLRVESRLLRGEREPLIYRERRVSGGREFDLLKFRILSEAALRRARAEHGELAAIKRLERDPANLSWTGRWLKKWYLDELPQLLNVWRGEMSLVGPRPWDRRAHERGLEAGDTLPKQLLPCGIVGPVQMRKSEDRGRPRIDPEHDYLDAYRTLGSLALLKLDAQILWRSLRVALRGEGY